MKPATPRKIAPAYMFTLVILTAVNLRPALTSIGPLIGEICKATGITLSAAGFLNSLPLLAFAVFAPLGGLTRRFGLERMMAVAFALLIAGLLIRSIGSVTALFGGTICLAAGIAVGNVLVPGIIKRDFPTRVHSMTMLYAMTLGITAAVASGVTVPLSHHLEGGWRTALSIWVLPALLAALAWAPLAIRKQQVTSSPVTETPLHRSPVAWFVTAFMGLQSLFAYVIVGWFPVILQSHGYSPFQAGGVMTVFQLVALTVSLTIPYILRRGKDQSQIAVSASLIMVISVLGFIVYPQFVYLWIILMGLGCGSCLMLALSFIGLRSANHHEAASLSIMSQSLGYLLAAVGPIMFGIIHDLVGGWNSSLITLMVIGLIQALFGFLAGKERTVFQRSGIN